MSQLEKTWAQIVKSENRDSSNFIINEQTVLLIQKLENEKSSLERELEHYKNESNNLKRKRNYCSICCDNVPDNKSFITFSCCNQTLCSDCAMNWYYQCTNTPKNCPLCNQTNDYGETHFKKIKENNKQLKTSLENMVKLSKDLKQVYTTVKNAYTSSNIIQN